MLSTILRNAKEHEPPEGLLDNLLGLATAMDDEHSLAQSLAYVVSPVNQKFSRWQFSAVAGLLDALDRRNSSLNKLLAGAGTDLKAAINKLGPIFDQARALAQNQPGSSAPPETEIALRLLGRGLSQSDTDCELLGKLLQPQFPASLQRAALASLRRLNRNHVADILLANWRASSPALRGEIISALFTRPEWTQSLLAALETKQIPMGQIAPADQQKLIKHKTPSIRERAQQILSAVASDRNTVVESYRRVAELAGNTEKGAALFKQNCAVCHRPPGQPQLAPDLGALAGKPIETYLIAILDPNRAVESRYVNYMATTKDGRDLSGIIAAETSNSITLRSQNAEETILRADLESLSSSGLSLMPEGLEKTLSPQDLSDIIAFIQKGAAPKLEAIKQ